MTDCLLTLSLAGLVLVGVALGRALERCAWQEAVERLWDSLDEGP